MRQLNYDGLEILSSNRDGQLDKSIFNDDVKFVDECVYLVNKWHSKAIERYIFKYDPGNYLKANADNLENMYFGFIDGKLAVTSVVSDGYKLNTDNILQLKEYVNACELLSVQQKEGRMNIKDVIYAINHANEPNNIYVNFVVVNPEMVGQGIGTATMKAIQDNTEFFSGSSDTHIIDTKVFYNNSVSKSMLSKAGFKPITTKYERFTNFEHYYYVFSDGDTMDK